MKTKALVAGLVALGGMGVTSSALADVSGNIGIASQYVFRGVVYGDPQVSGGLDWSGDDGLYAGTWISSAAGEQEVNFYGGYAGESFDIGYIYYYFPDNAGTNDTQEVYASVSLDALSLTAYYAPAGFLGAEDDEYVYLSGDYSLPLSDKAELGLHVGVTEVVGDAADAPGAESTFIDYGVSISAGDLFLSVTAIDFDAGVQEANDPTFTVGYSWSFDDVL